MTSEAIRNKKKNWFYELHQDYVKNNQGKVWFADDASFLKSFLSDII